MIFLGGFFVLCVDIWVSLYVWMGGHFLFLTLLFLRLQLSPLGDKMRNTNIFLLHPYVPYLQLPYSWFLRTESHNHLLYLETF